MDEAFIEFVNFWTLTPIVYFLRVLLVVFVSILLRRLWLWGKKSGRVTVVVMGDIGRSPRMAYHSLSLAQHGYHVNHVGYAGSTPHKSLLESKYIQLCYIKQLDLTVKWLPRVLNYILKVLSQSLCIFWVLFVKTPGSEFILMQNPPCIPSMAFCFLLSIWNGSKLIIDWHNYGYSILSLSLGSKHILVKIAKFYEEFFGQLSSGNLCVTRAMQEDMFNSWHIGAEVMHDRAPDMFKIIDVEQKHYLFAKLAQSHKQFTCQKKSSNETRFTSAKGNGKFEMLENRPALIVSSTSWTEDEDFSILLEAMEIYESKVASSEGSLPNVLCVITGKGPQKTYYENIIKTKKWHYVEIMTLWLEAEDYPTLLGCADLGVSLHTSSSGLDLPMKVVDMFGCGLPVAAINFNCLDELVQHNVNGFVFDGATELAEYLHHGFTDFPGNQKVLEKFRRNILKFKNVTWNDTWDRVALPMFKDK